LSALLIEAIAPADEEDVIYALNAKDTARALGLSSAASTRVRTRRVPLASRQRGHARGALVALGSGLCDLNMRVSSGVGACRGF